MKARDPRLRPYRAALWAVYFVIVVGGVGLVTISVARNLRVTNRPVRADPCFLPTKAALRLCLGDLEGLYREGNERAWALGTGMETADPLGSWQTWARAWEARVEDLGERCRLDGPATGPEAVARSELAAGRDALLALHRAYATQVARFAQEHGDLARGAAEALAHAREAVGRAQ